MNKTMVDILWIIIAAILVFLMQPGFMCLESGLTRAKNSINVAIKNLADFIFSVIAFWTIGYGIMFGTSNMGVIGTNSFFINFDSDYYLASFFLFQVMFCGTATTIFSGAVAERMSFSAYLIISFLIAGLIYPIFGHWAWNGLDQAAMTGFIGKRGFVDFAGSTVVHSIGGWVSLAALIIIGPRLGRFNDNGSPVELNPSNLVISVLGTLLLWAGWFGFNGGSTLLMNKDVPLIIVRTTLAGASGAISCLFIGWFISKIPKTTYLINGSLGGLVAITANCHCVNALDSVIIGIVAGGVALFTESFLLKFKIDDAVGAIPVHLGCGIWGTLAVALFGDPESIGTGLGFFSQLLIQMEGIFMAFVVGFLITYLFLKIINKFMPLRVTSQDEELGLNVSEHGARTDLLDLFQAMDVQAQTGDLSFRVHEEPFTEVGRIANRYNSVMEALEKAVKQTDAIVKNAKDAIITFAKDSLEVMNINPNGALMFGYETSLGNTIYAKDLFVFDDKQDSLDHFYSGKNISIQARKKNGDLFPIEAVVTEATVGTDSFYVGVFRDITERYEKELSLKRSEKRYRSFFENTGTASIIIEEDLTILTANSEFEFLSGYSKQDIESKMKITEVFAKEETTKIKKYHTLRRIDFDKAPKSYETKLLDKLGFVKPVYLSLSMIPDTNRSVGSMIDLTKLKQAEQDFQKQRAYFHQLFENSPLAIVLIDIEGKIIDVNTGFENLFGYNANQVIGEFNRHIVVPEDRATESESFSSTVRSGRSIHRETFRKHKDGRVIPVSVLGYPIKIDGNVEGIFYIYEDISERKSFEKQLYQQAFYDSLTNIPNRVLFMERLERAVERSKRRQDYSFAVLLIDLDRFKWVNDSLGHMAGDTLLKEVSQRFKQCIRSVDTVARLGGDEFAILLEEFDGKQDVIRVARRIQSVAEKPFYLEGNEAHISASIGIVLTAEWYQIPENILRDADIAMYRAKELGKARFKVFNKKMHDLAVESLQLENELRRAIHGGELTLYYQPIVSVKTQLLEGFEALVRWNHPKKGLIPPNRFIPVAEETGLIISLGQWVIKEACRQMKEWQKNIPEAKKLTVNVNVSTRQFLQKNLVDFIISVLEETMLEPKFLKIELTESSIMKNPKSAIEQLNRMKALGLQLIIDDFGTGYSSLSYLQSFPIDCLKIDRSFISGKKNEKENLEIVKTIIGLAKNLGLTVVAEGVEEENQLDNLRNISCDNAQGFLFSKPVDSSMAADIIKRLQ